VDTSFSYLVDSNIAKSKDLARVKARQEDFIEFD